MTIHNPFYYDAFFVKLVRSPPPSAAVLYTLYFCAVVDCRYRGGQFHFILLLAAAFQNKTAVETFLRDALPSLLF